MPWVKKFKNLKKNSNFFFEALTTRPWLVGIYLIFFPEIVLSAIKHFFFGNKIEGKFGIYFQKFFTLNFFFGALIVEL
jgi:hypothetical protein